MHTRSLVTTTVARIDDINGHLVKLDAYAKVHSFAALSMNKSKD